MSVVPASGVTVGNAWLNVGIGAGAALADGAGLDLPLAKATAAQYDRMIALGLGELDKSGVAELTFASRRAKA